MATETTTEQQTNSQPDAGSTGAETSAWWCNFCDFRTDNAQEYIAHSCQDVLAKRGVEVKPTGRNECS